MGGRYARRRVRQENIIKVPRVRAMGQQDMMIAAYTVLERLGDLYERACLGTADTSFAC